MQTKVLFLISAQMQSGKDEFGEALSRAFGCSTCAFANPVKEVAIAMVGMPSAVAYGGEKERRAWKRYCVNRKTCKNATHDACSDAREWLQWVGTELGRDQVHKDVWIHRLLERLREGAGPGFVITDSRFENELFKGYDNTVWFFELAAFIGAHYPRVFRPVRIRLKRPGKANTDTHRSEVAQLEIPDERFDHLVVNDGTLSDLKAVAEQIAKLYIAS